MGSSKHGEDADVPPNEVGRQGVWVRVWQALGADECRESELARSAYTPREKC